MVDDTRIEELRRRVRKDPASLAFAQLAEELRRAHRFLEAVAVCRAGLEIYPGYLSARVTLGRCFIDLNRLDDAKTELEKVREVAPENLVAIRALAEIRERRAAAGVRQWAENAGLTPPPSVDSPASLERAVEGPDSNYDGTTFEVWTKVGPAYHGAAPEGGKHALSAHPSTPTQPRGQAGSGRAVEGPDAFGGGGKPALSARPSTGSGRAVEGSDAAYDGTASEGGKHALSARPSTGSGRAVEGPDAMPESETSHDAVRTLAALQAWLDAIHVTRASRSA